MKLFTNVGNTHIKDGQTLTASAAKSILGDLMDICTMVVIKDTEGNADTYDTRYAISLIGDDDVFTVELRTGEPGSIDLRDNATQFVIGTICHVEIDLYSIW